MKHPFLLALAGALSLGVATTAIADHHAEASSTAPAMTAPAATAPAEAYTAYRHNQMEAIGKHMKLLYMISEGKAPFVGHATAHAEAMHALVETIPELFPAGTGPDKVKSDSLPEIWQQWGKFVELSKENAVETGKLVEAAKTGDVAKLKTQFQATRKSCGSCHDMFRVDDEH